MDQSAPKKTKTSTLVWLRKNNHRSHIFYCPSCMYPLLKYQGAIAAIVPGASYDEPKPEEGDFVKVVMNFPIIIECRGKSAKWGHCTAVYYFEGFTESVSTLTE